MTLDCVCLLTNANKSVGFLAQRLGLVEGPPALLDESQWTRVKNQSLARNDSILPCPICHESFKTEDQASLFKKKEMFEARWSVNAFCVAVLKCWRTLCWGGQGRYFFRYLSEVLFTVNIEKDFAIIISYLTLSCPVTKLCIVEKSKKYEIQKIRWNVVKVRNKWSKIGKPIEVDRKWSKSSKQSDRSNEVVCVGAILSRTPVKVVRHKETDSERPFKWCLTATLIDWIKLLTNYLATQIV